MPTRPDGEVGERRSWDDVYRQPGTPQKMLRWATTQADMMTPLLRCESALEVGTGTGMLSGFLARCGVKTTTLDLSVDVQRVAAEFYKVLNVYVETVQGDGMASPFLDDSFDAVFSQGLWEHFDDAHVRAFAREGLRVAPIVYASVPSRFYPHAGRRGPGLVGNERLMSARAWEKILEGFHVSARYFADWKVLTVGGVTVPWPNHVLITVSRF